MSLAVGYQLDLIIVSRAFALSCFTSDVRATLESSEAGNSVEQW